jgi:hypothetical protein
VGEYIAVAEIPRGVSFEALSRAEKIWRID